MTLSDDKALFDAVWGRDVERAALLLREGADVDGRDVLKRTPLHCACLLQPPARQVAALLIDHRADLRAVDEHGLCPLLTAARSGDVGLVGLLAERGADLHAKSLQQFSALHYAAERSVPEIVQFLLEAGLEADAANQFGSTPLIELAAWSGRPSQEGCRERAAALLIDAGARLDAQRHDGRTALMLAATHSLELLTLLVSRGALLDLVDRTGSSALAYAAGADSGRKEKVARLLGRGASTAGLVGAKAAYQAVARNDCAVLSLLVDAGLDVDVRDEAGFTPLMHALCLHRTEAAQFLLEAGADPCARSDVEGAAGGQTVIGCALGALDDLFFERGAPPPVPLAFAERLVQRGADVDAADGAGQTPLFFVFDNPAACSFLLEHGADIHHRTPLGRTPLIAAAASQNTAALQQLIARGADVGAAQTDGFTALAFAVLHGRLAHVRILLQAGSAVDCRTAGGFTPLMLAASGGTPAEAMLEIAKALVAHGADVDAQGGAENRTPLMHAVLQGRTSLVRFLLEAGASTEIRDGAGNTARDLAGSPDRGENREIREIRALLALQDRG